MNLFEANRSLLKQEYLEPSKRVTFPPASSLNATAIDTEKKGNDRKKLVVPSRGSMIQRKSPDLRFSPASSESMES